MFTIYTNLWNYAINIIMDIILSFLTFIQMTTFQHCHHLHQIITIYRKYWNFAVKRTTIHKLRYCLYVYNRKEAHCQYLTPELACFRIKSRHLRLKDMTDNPVYVLRLIGTDLYMQEDKCYVETSFSYISECWRLLRSVA